jgi:5-methylcytosine-specific restriction endonuclease McrA
MDMPPLTPKPRKYNRKPRPTTAQRGYGGNWPKVRKAKLNADPVCQMPGCPGRFATQVHHADHDTANNSPANLISTCTECHMKYHAQHSK